jgi:uncharacterized protein (TIGR00369 family)
MADTEDDAGERLINLAKLMNYGSPQAVALGLETLEIGHARALIRLPYREDLIGDPETGVIAGGVVTTLLDHTCGQAVFAALSDPTSVATLDLRIDYMRRAEPGLDVFVAAHCYKLTSSIAFVRATAYDRDIDDPVAAAQAAFMLNSSAGRAPGANLKPAGRAQGAQ